MDNETTFLATKSMHQPLPAGWAPQPSKSRPGENTYVNQFTKERISWFPSLPASRTRGQLPPPPGGHQVVPAAGAAAAIAGKAGTLVTGSDERRPSAPSLETPLLNDTQRKVAKLQALRDHGIITQDEFLRQASLIYGGSGSGGGGGGRGGGGGTHAHIPMAQAAPAPMAAPEPQYATTYGTTAAAPVNTQIVVMQRQPRVAYVPDHCCMSWFVFFCCCWPLGCCALCESSNVQSAMASGDVERARVHSEKARCLNNWGLMCGIVIITLNILQFSCTVDFLSICPNSQY